MILLTGATGYIGSHTWVELLAAGHEVLGIDNFSNSSEKVLERIEAISGKKVSFLRGDVNDQGFLLQIFQDHSVDVVVHFAALKAVGESVQIPLSYYQNNLGGLMTLLRVMKRRDCKNIVFSSSATVYHPDNSAPYVETMSLGSTNPYGWTKFMSEQLLRDLETSDPHWAVAFLRYFNPVGAHESGLIGEAPLGVPNNLMPYLSQVAVGQREYLSVYGQDWPTHDGTGVRDYIHVVDLARGHLKAVDYLVHHHQSLTVNLGTGRGYSVMEVIKAFEGASGQAIPYKVVGRRSGDIATCYANIDLAKQLLNWTTEYDLNRMCVDAWRWQSKNPRGFEK